LRKEHDDEKIFFSDVNNICFVFYVDNNKLASMSANFDAPVYFINNIDSDMNIEISDVNFTKKNKKVGKLKFTITNNPLTNALSPQSLDYQFFVFLRN